MSLARLQQEGINRAGNTPEATGYPRSQPRSLAASHLRRGDNFRVFFDRTCAPHSSAYFQTHLLRFECSILKRQIGAEPYCTISLKEYLLVDFNLYLWYQVPGMPRQALCRMPDWSPCVVLLAHDLRSNTKCVRLAIAHISNAVLTTVVLRTLTPCFVSTHHTVLCPLPDPLALCACHMTRVQYEMRVLGDNPDLSNAALSLNTPSIQPLMLHLHRVLYSNSRSAYY